MGSYFNNSDLARTGWTKPALLAVVAYLSIILSALLVVLPKFRAEQFGGGTDVAIGPIVLFKIDKVVSAGGGYDLVFQLRPGLLILLVICLAVALALRAVISRRNRGLP